MTTITIKRGKFELEVSRASVFLETPWTRGRVLDCFLDLSGRGQTTWGVETPKTVKI